MSKVFAIIPARGGSIGVPDKNIARVGGVPLLVRPYRIAKSLPFDVRTIISTDRESYLALLRAEGYEDQSLRPAELATSGALVIDTVIHELARAEAQDSDLVLLLEPSYVGRRRENIIVAVDRVRSGATDSSFGVSRVPLKFHYTKQYVREGDGVRPVGTQANVNRQQLSPAFVRSGEFYLSRVGLVRAERSLFGGRLSMLETLQPFANIDNAEDLAAAQLLPDEFVD